MINITDNGTVMVKRGDTFNVPLFINIGSDEEPVRLDFTGKSWLLINFNIHRAGVDGPVLFSKIFSSKDVNQYGDIMVKLLPEDTKELRSGIYEYSISLSDTTDPSFNYTVTPNKQFYIF